MYKNHLEVAIKGNNLPKSLLLYGEDFFSTYYTKRILPLLGDKDNILSFYFDEYHYESAKNFIAQPSLFGDVNILYIRHDKKVPKKELDSLVGLCQKNPTSHLLYQFSGEDRVAKELTKSFGKKKSADFVRFFKPHMGEAMSMMQQQAQKLGLDIENYALQHLFMVQNEDLSLSMNELSKLTLLDKKVTAADIDKHVYGMGEMGMDEFIAKVLNKEDIREQLQKLLESGSFDEVKIINTIQSYMVQLFMFNAFIKVHGRYDVLEILGFPLPQNLAQQRAAQCIKINIPTYQKILKHLLEAEHTLKIESNIDKNSYTFSTLIKLQSYL
ncbi:MAG: DNA polymerase III subunit delta [Epsilonproteobacteria bacterium]|nr:DNA polymerase III subunit delta [Campylobacterota bacterium]